MKFQRKRGSLFSLLTDSAPDRVFISLLFGIAAGLAYALIIPLILLSLSSVSNKLIEPASDQQFYLGGYLVVSPKFALAYIFLCGFILITRTASLVLLNHVAIQAALQLRERLYQRISHLPIAELENIGPSKLLAIITTDVPRLIMGATAIPNLLISSVTIFGSLLLLLYMNANVFYFIILVIILGAVTYRIPVALGQKYLAKAREVFDRIQEGIRGLLYGAKELKLNKHTRSNFMNEELSVPESLYCSNQKRAAVLILSATSYGTLISFFAIGVVAYALAPFYGLENQNTVGIVMVLLYITGPLSVILNSVTPILSGAVSAKKLEDTLALMPVETTPDSEDVLEFSSLSLRQIEYSYLAEDKEQPFLLGPIDLTLKRGEILFIVGGNGCGKSTLGKLLSLHYIPSSGSIHFGDTEVTAETREKCRQDISAVFPDYYLFNKLFSITDPTQLEAAGKYLKYLKLDNKVNISKQEFSTLALSSGQRKRLALLISYVEDKNLYIFDEWAADQDPEFKEVFYRHILSDLKAAQKIVVVITHDDRYFEVADRVVKLENGIIA